MRVRKFTNRGSTTKVIGKFPSLKNGKPVWWESQLERDFLYLLEIDDDVVSYYEQPLRIPYRLNGKQHFYTPDFLVNRKSERQIVEVKPEGKALKPESILLFRSVEPLCYEAGYKFVVATDKMIRVQPRLDNIKLLWRYSRMALKPQHIILCHEILSDKGFVQLRDAFGFFVAKGAAKEAVYALAYHGAIAVDLTQPLNADSLVYSPDVFSANKRKAS